MTAAIAFALGIAVGISFERYRPCGTRWANRETVKLAISLGRSAS